MTGILSGTGGVLPRVISPREDPRLLGCFYRHTTLGRTDVRIPSNGIGDAHRTESSLIVRIVTIFYFGIFC